MLLLWMFCLVHFIVALEDSNFIDPVEVSQYTEFYDFDGVRYGIHLEKVTYAEAEILCKARKSDLVEILREEDARFLSRALAESACGYTSLWVGAKRVGAFEKPGIYKWNNGQPIGSGENQYPQTKYPFWVDKPDSIVNESHCVAMDRRGHEDPLLIDLACSTSRPFICQAPTGNGSGNPDGVTPAINGKEKTFHLFHAEYTWQEALSFCRERGFRLASLEFDVDYDLVSHRMLRSRPIIENAWTSGYYSSDGNWKWMSNDKIIPPYSKETENASDAPPWYRKENGFKKGCLLADRHICKTVVFVEADCSRKRSILCEEIPKVTEEPDLKQIQNSTFWISTKTESWEAAYRKCISCFPDHSESKLLTLEKDEPNILEAVHHGMTITLRKDIRHIWISGRLGVSPSENTTFYWVTKDIINSTDPWPESSKVHNPSVSHNGIKYKVCLVDNSTGNSFFDVIPHPCLNLDREDQTNFFAYGLKCDFSQHYICDTSVTDAKLSPMCLSASKPSDRQQSSYAKGTGDKGKGKRRKFDHTQSTPAVTTTTTASTTIITTTSAEETSEDSE